MSALDLIAAFRRQGELTKQHCGAGPCCSQVTEQTTDGRGVHVTGRAGTGKASVPHHSYLAAAFWGSSA